MKVLSIEVLKVELEKFSKHYFKNVTTLKPFLLEVAPSELVDALVEAVECYEIHDLAEQILMCSPVNHKPYLQLAQEHIDSLAECNLNNEDESALAMLREFGSCYEALENARPSGVDIEDVELVSEEEMPNRIEAQEMAVKNITPKLSAYVDWTYYFETTTYNEYSTVELDLTQLTGETHKFFYK